MGDRCLKNYMLPMVLYFLLGVTLWMYFWRGSGNARPESIPVHEVPARKVSREFVSLVLKKDICALLDYCNVPPVARSKRPFFAPSPPSQTKIRLDRDKLLREYIDRLRELILVFHRLAISEKSTIRQRITREDFSHTCIIAFEIETPASPSAASISPTLEGKDLTLSFSLTIQCLQGTWRIIRLSKANITPERS